MGKATHTRLNPHNKKRTRNAAQVSSIPHSIRENEWEENVCLCVLCPHTIFHFQSVHLPSPIPHSIYYNALSSTPFQFPVGNEIRRLESSQHSLTLFTNSPKSSLHFSNSHISKFHFAFPHFNLRGREYSYILSSLTLTWQFQKKITSVLYLIRKYLQKTSILFHAI